MGAVVNDDKFARSSQGRKPVIIKSSERPFSNFQYIDRHFQGLRPLRRIFSQARALGAKTIIIEAISTADDISEENEDIKKLKCLISSKTFRISFFKKKIKRLCSLKSLHNEDFIGYAIVKKDKFSKEEKAVHIFESVVKTSRHENNFVRGSQTWNCLIGGRVFHIEGYLYAQQNALTKVCAHVAARTIATCYHENGDMTYREMNQLIGVDHTEILNGMRSDDLIKIIEATGAKCFVADYKEEESSEKLPFQKVLYGSIESGFPAIVVFDTTKTNTQHAIPVFGHTFNEDTWSCHADQGYFEIGKTRKFIPSETWLSTFIAHDDNFGSNFCIPQQYLHTARKCNENQKKCQFEKDCVAHIIATYPKAVETNSVAAELIGFDYLDIFLKEILSSNNKKYKYFDEYWRGKLAEHWHYKRLVLRTILIRACDYPEHLEKVRDWKGNKINVSLIEEADAFSSYEWLWMIELSIPELFSANKRKLGEVIIKAEIRPDTKRNFSSFIMARIPGYFVTLSNPSNQTFDYWPSDANSHVELYGCEES